MWVQTSEHRLNIDINITLLKAREEDSGTAAVNMAAIWNGASWEGVYATAFYIFTLEYLDLGTNFPWLTYLIPSTFPNLCWLNWASVEVLGALPCRLSFYVSHFSNLPHKGTINFVKEITRTSSPLFGNSTGKQEKRTKIVLKVLNNSLSLWETQIGSDRGKSRFSASMFLLKN